MVGQITVEIMNDFANGWNKHDIDKLMSYMPRS